MNAALGPLEILILASIFTVFPNVTWARRDAGVGKYHPLRRAMTVAAVILAFFIAYVFVTFLRAQSQASVQVHIAWVGLSLALLIGFVILTFVGWLSYLLRYRSADKTHRGQGAADNVEPTIRVEETGNPYQPPST